MKDLLKRSTKRLNFFEKIEIGGDDNILNYVNETETLISKDRTIEDLKKDFRGKIEEIEEASKS